MKTVTVNNIQFQVQSYGKGDQANVIPVFKGLKYSSIIIDLKGKIIKGSYGKQCAKWKELVSSFSLNELIMEINRTHNQIL